MPTFIYLCLVMLAIAGWFGLGVASIWIAARIGKAPRQSAWLCLFAVVIIMAIWFLSIVAIQSSNAIVALLGATGWLFGTLVVVKIMTQASTSRSVLIVTLFLLIFLIPGTGYQAVMNRTILDAYQVTDVAMYPSLVLGDHAMVDKTRNPRRGNVVLFRTPTGELLYFRRVLGLPGETIVITSDVSGTMVEGSTIFLEPLEGAGHTGDVTIVLEPHHFFLVGDDLPRSRDSRLFGPVRSSEIFGVARLIYYPLHRIRILQ